jgi:uncharacterized protein (DUF1330 family)
MPAYFIVDVEVFEPHRYEEYRRQVAPTMAAYDGRFLVRGGASEVIEGDWQPHRLVVLEFPSVARFKEWYHSPEYSAILSLRLQSSHANAIVVEGV